MVGWVRDLEKSGWVGAVGEGRSETELVEGWGRVTGLVGGDGAGV